MRRAALLIFMCLILCGCKAGEYEKSIFAMDTVMDLKIYSKDENALLLAQKEIERLDVLLDRGNPESGIYKINEEKTAEVSEETASLIEEAVSISSRTHGAFDITTAPLSDLWGFYGGNFRIPSDSEIESALNGVGYGNIKVLENTVSVKENTKIDMGAIAKGYAADRICALLKDNGVKNAVISLGGNVQVIGCRPNGRAWTVGITDPENTSQIIGTLNVADKAVVTSGAYQRNFTENGKTYHHIIDPKTGKSADSGLSSVTVISDSGANADALSTALFVMGYEKAEKLWRESNDFEAVFIDGDGEIRITEGIANSFSCDREYEVSKR